MARTSRPSVLAGLCLLSFGTAHAQETELGPRRVILHLEDCLGADAPAVRRIVAAELGDALVGIEGDRSAPTSSQGSVPSSASAGATDSTLVRASCGVESAIVVASHDRGVRVERRVDLASSAERTRSRLLALSITELVASTWALVDTLPAPLPPSPSVAVEEPAPIEPPAPRRRPRRAAPPPEPPSPPPPERPIGIRAIAVARVAGTPVHIAGGGGLGIEVGLPFSLGVGADLRYEQGEVDAGPLGVVINRVAWGTLLALVRPVVGWSSVTVGVGAKLGAAWLEGVGAPSVGGRTHAGFVGGPAIASYVSLHVAGAGYLHVGLELSWIFAGIEGLNGATGDVVASFSGPQLAITAGFEIQPSR